MIKYDVLMIMESLDPRYYFSNKYLRNLLNEKKAKEALAGIYFQYWRFLCLKRCNLATFKLQQTLV